MKVYQSVIILLLVANLVATVWFGVSEQSAPIPTATETAAKNELPSLVDAKERNHMLEEFTEKFNSSDYDGLYNMFGEAAKAQFTKESAESNFKKLKKFFYSVDGGAFTYSELVGTKGNTNYYLLYYTVKLSEKSEFGTSGNLKITIAVQGSEYQIYGISLNAG